MEEMQEIGVEGYKNYRKTLKFGDIVENGWASERNPIRFGIVIEVKVKTIRMTNGEDKFWELCFDPQTKLKVHGNITNKTLADFKGSVFTEVTPNITLGCISPEARDLLDTIMEHWEQYLKDYKASNNKEEPTHYGFAYWLVRWSGLIQPVSQNEK